MNLINKSNQLRKDIIKVACKHNKGHIAPSLSCLDILVALYYKVMDKKDAVILSKGHGCYGLYAIWADKGIISKRKWKEFDLAGCLEGYGSLGHGLPVATGIAYARKLLNKKGHVWCIVGDGELQEGSMYEAINFIKHYKLDNITVIVDRNHLQAMGFCVDIIEIDPCSLFNNCVSCNGHNFPILVRELKKKPNFIICQTIKGKGLPFMENIAKWHYRVPTKKELKYES